MAKLKVDYVEGVQLLYNLSAFDVFVQCCEDCNGMDRARTNMFYEAYVTEDLIPDFVVYWCLMKLSCP